MIIKENISETFIKTYSDKGVLIQKVGTDEKYEEAYDLIESSILYIETDTQITVLEENKNNI